MTPTLLQLRHTAHSRLHQLIRAYPHRGHDGLLYGVTPNATEWSVHTATLTVPQEPHSASQAYQRGIQDGWQAAIGYRRGHPLKLLGVWQYRPDCHRVPLDVHAALQLCPYPFDVIAPICVGIHLDTQDELVADGHQFSYDGTITVPVDLS